jgi:hypothetical protein
MRNKKLKALYRELMNTKLNFIKPGGYLLNEIYAAVKNQFPELCDDKLICAKVCSQGTQNPEWQHRVRNALQNLKAAGHSVSKGESRGYWIIH